MNNDVLSDRMRNKSTGKKIRAPAVIRTQDLLNTSQILLPLSHLENKLHKQHCLEASSLERVRISWNSTEDVACLRLLCQGSKWLSSKSIWLVFRRSLVRIPVGSWIFLFFLWIYFSLFQQKHQLPVCLPNMLWSVSGHMYVWIIYHWVPPLLGTGVQFSSITFL